MPVHCNIGFCRPSTVGYWLLRRHWAAVMCLSFNQASDCRISCRSTPGPSPKLRVLERHYILSATKSPRRYGRSAKLERQNFLGNSVGILSPRQFLRATVYPVTPASSDRCGRPTTTHDISSRRVSIRHLIGSRNCITQLLYCI